MKGRKYNIKPKTLAAFLLFFLCLAMGMLVFLIRLSEDTTAPEIFFDQETIILTEEEANAVLKKDYACLLEEMSAMDDRDHDVTGRIIVYDVELYENNAYAVIRYRVMDKSGNMETAYRLAYLSTPMEIYTEVLASISEDVNEMIDKWIEQYQGDEEKDEEAPVLEMVREVNISVGEEFDPGEYVVTLEDDQDSYETLLQNGRMEGNYNTDVPGVYPLAFYVTDSDGNESNAAVLILTVTREGD